MTKPPRTTHGFTIVELLIVIVVIGILVAITIVAYNGIQGRAQAAAVASALEQVSKKLALYSIDNSAYPVDLATAGITSSGGTSYQYTVNNAATPQTYCITGTNGTTSYQINSTNTIPTSGGCAGHGVGGMSAITNLAINPSAETGTANWGTYVAGGTVTTSRPAGGAYSGNSYYRITWTGNSTLLSGGFYPFNMGLGVIVAGKTYTSSAWVRSSKNQVVYMSASYKDTSGTTLSTSNGTSVNLTANTWTRVNATMSAAPVGSNSVLATVYATTGGSMWIVNDYIDGDAAMLSESTTLYNYADGASTGWIWNGAVSVSSSTGPAL